MTVRGQRGIELSDLDVYWHLMGQLIEWTRATEGSTASRSTRRPASDWLLPEAFLQQRLRHR